MGKKEQLVKRWRENRPAEVPINDVKTVIEGYFKSDCIRQRSSHIIISHKKLANFPNFGLYGELSIPIYKGQKVKGIYIRRLLYAIELIEG